MLRNLQGLPEEPTIPLYVTLPEPGDMAEGEIRISFENQTQPVTPDPLFACDPDISPPIPEQTCLQEINMILSLFKDLGRQVVESNPQLSKGVEFYAVTKTLDALKHIRGNEGRLADSTSEALQTLMLNTGAIEKLLTSSYITQNNSLKQQLEVFQHKINQLVNQHVETILKVLDKRLPDEPENMKKLRQFQLQYQGHTSEEPIVAQHFSFPHYSHWGLTLFIRAPEPRNEVQVEPPKAPQPFEV